RDLEGTPRGQALGYPDRREARDEEVHPRERGSRLDPSAPPGRRREPEGRPDRAEPPAAPDQQPPGAALPRPLSSAVTTRAQPSRHRPRPRSPGAGPVP